MINLGSNSNVLILSQVAEAYDLVKRCLADPPVKSYVPSSWHSICVVKVTFQRSHPTKEAILLGSNLRALSPYKLGSHTWQ